MLLQNRRAIDHMTMGHTSPFVSVHVATIMGSSLSLMVHNHNFSFYSPCCWVFSPFRSAVLNHKKYTILSISWLRTRKLLSLNTLNHHNLVGSSAWPLAQTRPTGPAGPHLLSIAVPWRLPAPRESPSDARLLPAAWSHSNAGKRTKEPT